MNDCAVHTIYNLLEPIHHFGNLVQRCELAHVVPGMNASAIPEGDDLVTHLSKKWDPVLGMRRININQADLHLYSFAVMCFRSSSQRLSQSMRYRRRGMSSNCLRTSSTVR